MVHDTHIIIEPFLIRKMPGSLKNDQARIRDQLLQFAPLPEWGVHIPIAPDQHRGGLDTRSERSQILVDDAVADGTSIAITLPRGTS